MQTNKEKTKKTIERLIDRYRDWARENDFNLKNVDTDVTATELETENYMLNLFIHSLKEISSLVETIAEINA